MNEREPEAEALARGARRLAAAVTRKLSLAGFLSDSAWPETVIRAIELEIVAALSERPEGQVVETSE
jgi:hypothetical protein